MTGNTPFYSMTSRNDTYDIQMISGLFYLDDPRKRFSGLNRRKLLLLIDMLESKQITTRS